MQGEKYMAGRAAGAAGTVAAAAAAAVAAALASSVPIWFCIACPVSRALLRPSRSLLRYIEKYCVLYGTGAGRLEALVSWVTTPVQREGNTELLVVPGVRVSNADCRMATLWLTPAHDVLQVVLTCQWHRCK